MRGFNLIETMIVVAIIGIAAALAVPKMLPEIHKAQLDGDAEALANFVARARAEAMLSKRCVRVHLGAPITNAVATATTSTTIAAETLNSFDCEVAVPSGGGLLIDPVAGTAFIQLDQLNTSNPNVSYSTLAADGAIVPGTAGDVPTGSIELRFRPNGRVWSGKTLADAYTPTNNWAIVVKHALLATEMNATAARRAVVIQSNGLVCALDRGVTATATCP